MILDKLWRTQWREKRYMATTERQIKQLRSEGKHDKASSVLHEMNYELELWCHTYVIPQ